MPQLKPEYAALDDFEKIAQQIIDKFPEVYSGIDLSIVKCVVITNKECPDSKKGKPWEVKAVPQPIRMDCPYSYYVTIYQKDWVEMDEAHKAMLVATILLAIPVDKDKEGKTNNFDLKDFSVMLRTFGVDYQNSDTIPNILTDAVQWKVN